MSSFGMALTTFVGQNYGAGKYDRVRKGIKDTGIMASIAAVMICSILFIKAEFFFSLFTPDQAVSLARPFWRRRLMTLRPAAVAMRAKKPIRRLRRRFEG